MEKPLKVIRSGELKLGNLVMKVRVLENGERIIEEQSMIDFMELLEKGSIPQHEAEKFAKDLKSF